MSVGCYKQMSAIKEGVVMRLQCSNVHRANPSFRLSNVIIQTRAAKVGFEDDRFIGFF